MSVRFSGRSDTAFTWKEQFSSKDTTRASRSCDSREKEVSLCCEMRNWDVVHHDRGWMSESQPDFQLCEKGWTSETITDGDREPCDIAKVERMGTDASSGGRNG